MLKDKYDSIKKITKVKIPIFIMHGKKDPIVPFAMGAELFEEANNPKHSFFSENDDHMMNFNDQLVSKIANFISRY